MVARSTAGVGLHFDVVFQDAGPVCIILYQGAVFLLGEAEPICPDDDTVLQNHAIADAARLAHDRVGMREEIVADLRGANKS